MTRERARQRSAFSFIAPDEKPTVKSAVVYILEGELSNEELEKIKEYLINPVESREASLGVPATLKAKYPEPAPVATIKNFINYTDADLETYLAANSLAMDIEDLKMCREYFKEEGRDPSVAEIKGYRYILVRPLPSHHIYDRVNGYLYRSKSLHRPY